MLVSSDRSPMHRDRSDRGCSTATWPRKSTRLLQGRVTRIPGCLCGEPRCLNNVLKSPKTPSSLRVPPKDFHSRFRAICTLKIPRLGLLYWGVTLKPARGGGHRLVKKLFLPLVLGPNLIHCAFSRAGGTWVFMHRLTSHSGHSAWCSSSCRS